VLGVAYALCGADAGVDDVELTWLGLVGMTDPIRTGLDTTIRRLHAAGIRTVMITGDQAATAYAIAKELSLSGSSELVTVESKDLRNLDDRLLQALAKRAHVFARVSPADKLAIVTALQRNGNIVAMTGDGVNDGPALRAAHVGIAMGGAPQDVARSVADVVLEDDHLATIVTAIAQGRATHANIRKAIRYLIATNMSEIEVMAVALVLGLPAPLGALQLLWINLITDVAPALALSQEPAEADVMQHPPRDPRERVVSRTTLARLLGESATLTGATLASYAHGLARHGPGPSAQAHAFMTLTVSQLLHALHCRSDKPLLARPPLAPNPRLRTALFLLLAAQLATLWLPPLRRLLRIGRVSVLDTLVMIGAGSLPLILNDVGKRMAAAKHRNGQSGAPVDTQRGTPQ
jgi:Ca2+-transporting ATPase